MTEAEILAIQAEAAAAIGENGAVCTLRRPAEKTDPWSAAGQDTLIEVRAFRSYEKVRDPNGSFVGKSVTKLTMAAGGAIPLKSDEIAFGVAQAAVTSDTRFHGIMDIKEVGPTDVPVYYEVMLED